MHAFNFPRDSDSMLSTFAAAVSPRTALAAPATVPEAGARYLFIEGSLADQDMLANAAADGVRVVVLDSTGDGLAQIAATLQGVANVASIGIVSHGSAGVLTVGRTVLTNANLQQHQAILQAIGAQLAPGASIQLYGCSVGKGSAGRAFINALGHRHRCRRRSIDR